MQLFMGHIVPCLHFFERENIFSSCVSSTQFFFLKKTWFVSFYLSPPPLFFSKTVFPKTCFVFPIFIGGEIFFNLCGLQGELLIFIGGVVSISYRVELFCIPLILYFLLSFIAYVYSLLSCLCQYVTKRGEIQMKCGNPVCFVQGEIH